MNRNGFVLEYESYIEEIKATGYFFVHEKTGAELIHIPNDDRNKVFAIAFSTVPDSDKGEAHIAEHAVLSGSEKYPLRELFSNLMKGSMATFLNAMTFPDKTMYPVASQNDKDFWNLVNVYLDSAFHPNFYQEELSFRQEGHSFAFEGNGDEPYESGVVYSEMKGYEGSVDAALEDKASRALFNNTYQYNSGGVPSEILKLTYEEFVAFHKKHYTPSNARFFLYGDADLDTYLELLDKEYLSQYEKSERIPEPYDVKWRDKPVYVGGNYQSETELSALEMQFVLGDSDDLARNLCAGVLASYIFGQDSSSFKKTMIQSGFCQDMYGHLDSTRTVSVLKVTMHGVSETDAKKAEQRVFEELQKVDEERLKKGLRASLNNFGFHLREGESGSDPRGMDFMYPLLLHFKKGDDPFRRLRYEDLLEEAHTLVENGAYQRWIRDYMLDNQFRVAVLLIADPDYSSKQALQEKETLRQKWNELTVDEQKAEREWFEKLRVRQSTPDLKEDLERLPKLTIEDIKEGKKRRDVAESVEKITLPEGEVSEHKFIYYELDSKIAYIRIMFPLELETGEDAALISSASSVIGLLDTVHYTAEEINYEILMNSGGVGIGLDFYKNQSYLTVEIKTYPENIEKNLSVVSDILRCSKLSDRNRIYELLNQVKQRLRMDIVSSGSRYAAEKVLSFTNVENFNECHSSGIEYYKWLERFLESDDDERNKVYQRIENSLKDAITQKGVILCLTGSETSKQTLFDAMPSFLSKFSRGNDKAFKLPALEGMQKNAIITPAGVQFITVGGKLEEFEFNGHYHVLKAFITNDYLWNELRVKGGAYGAYSSIDRQGNFLFATYRDPSCAKTIEVIQSVVENLDTVEIQGDALEMMIIGAVSNMDQPLSPQKEGSRAVNRYFFGTNAEILARYRREIVETKSEDLRECAKNVKKALENIGYVVVGSEQKIEEDKKIFSEISRI